MKNLILYRHSCYEFSELGLDEIDLFCTDPQSGDVFFNKQGVIYYHSCKAPNLNVFFDWKTYNNIDTASDNAVPIIVGMCFNSLAETLCLAIDNGDVMSVDRLGEAQCVGCVPGGLTAMEWSYDQEAIALATQENSIIVMTATFDPVVEIDLGNIGFGEKQFVTVGWGKKETQFHGSEGKSAALSKSVNVSTSVGTKDDGQLRISWRGDGTLFAVSTLESNNERCIRVFSRDGVLQYTSEVVAGLEDSLAWRPSGNLIASTQRLSNKHQVAFFEKNGLRHGEFTLPFAHDEVEVQQLSWNGDSTILAVWLEHRLSFKSYIQLWTVGNYHWYLKQSLEFGPASHWSKHRPVGVCWHGDRLDVVDAGGRYSTFEYISATQRSRGETNKDGAYVAVIDGAHVLLTSFRSSVPPPPMCSWRADLPCNVNGVMFAADTSNRLCSALSNGSLAFLDPGTREVSQILQVKLNEVEHNGLLHHWLWTSTNQMLCCCTRGSKSTILTLEIAEELVCKNSCTVDGSIVSLVSKDANVIVQLSTGDLLRYSLELNVVEPLLLLPEPCSLVQVTETSILSLSKRNRLYQDSRQIANNVTSFVTRPPFILITTLQHRLIAIKLDDLDVAQNEICGDKAAGGEPATGRRIERGARLVTVVPNDTKVILQMPRGNLETVQPRSLCLNVASEYLDVREYRKAFLLFRKQRINLNLLCDHNITEFLQHAEHFVQEISDATWLSLFLTELRDDDTTTTMYAAQYKQRANSASVGKVSQVCSRLRDVMAARDDAVRLRLPIVTTHVRESNYGEALRMAAQDAAALKYLACLVDVDQLYDTALGLYDLELAAFVAGHTQKDPKEYLPFLNKIRKLDPDYQCYVIDEHLKRYALALTHIARCHGADHLQECLTLIKKHSLYSQAMALFSPGTPGYVQVATAFAEHLCAAKRYVEAAILYQRTGNEPRALEAFLLAGEWREVLSLAHKLEYNSSQLQELCRHRLVPELVSAGRHSEAAQIYSTILQDVEESIAVLSLGRRWQEAMWAAQQANRNDIIETHIRPGAEEHLRQMLEQISAARQTFNSHAARLKTVCAGKLAGQHDDVVDEAPREDCDLFSDTSSVSTRSKQTSSRSSSRSSKNRRKLERKMFSLKEGGAYEDLALIRALHELVTNTSNMHVEVSNLCRLLLTFHRDSDASTLQRSLSEVLIEMDQAKSEIWTPELLNSQTTMSFGPEHTTENIVSSLQSGGQQIVAPILLDPQLRFAPTIITPTSWKLEIL